MTTNQRNMLAALAILVLVLIAAGVVARSDAQAANMQRMPLMLKNTGAQASTPTPAPNGVVLITDLTMPFNVLGGVEPNAVQDRNGVWYISVYRIDAGDNNGSWIVAWQEGSTVVTPIGLVAAGANVASEPSIQAAPIANARGLLSLDYSRTRLFWFGWQDVPGGSRRPLLRVARVLNYVP